MGRFVMRARVEPQIVAKKLMMTVVTTSGAVEPEQEPEPGTGTPGTGTLATGTEATPAGKAKAEPAVTINSLDELLEYFINAGKKGVAINRYKGLGEMNPEQLWTTTMNPDGRTLLQVRAEDHMKPIRCSPR